jgi:hypothetical protein
MVKKFRRAAAGLEEQLPSDLRPPAVLKRTCDYLFNDVVGNASSLAHVHHFVWDRTRAIRNDFSIQQVTRPEELRIAIDCYERIARFHIVSLHQLALPQKPYSKYDGQQEREQLDRTLLSLMQYYDDTRGRIALSNESEFRAYCVIFQLQDPIPDLEDRIQTWPRSILRDHKVQKAMEVYMAACNVLDVQGPLKPRASHLIARQDWQRFWTMVASKEVSYLMACVAEIYFNLVRRTVLAALFKTSRANSNLATPDWTIDVLCDLLAFDDGDQVYEYCGKFGFTFKEREDDGQQYLDLTSVRGRNLPEPAAGIPKQTKTSLVEDKRFGRTIPAVINGLSVGQSRDAGQVVEEEDEGMDDAMEEEKDLTETVDMGSRHDENVDDGESLFIPEFKPQAQTSDNEKTGGPAVSAPPSIFSGIGGGSTFGKPSNSGDAPSIFAPSGQLDHSAPSHSHGSGSGLKFDFTKPSTTETPLFNFTNKTNGGSSDNETQNQVNPTFSWGSPSGEKSSTFPTSKTQTPLFQPPSTSISHSKEAQVEQPQVPKIAMSSEVLFFPEPAITPGSPAAAPALMPSPSPPAQALEVKAPQPHFTTTPSPSLSTSPTSSNQHSTLPAINHGLRRSPSVSDNRPKKPSPLVNSITASEETNTVIDDAPPASREIEATPSEARPSTPSTLPAEELEANITRIADEFFNAPVAGVLDQYIQFHIGRTITEVKNAFETEKANAVADEFRLCTLLNRYGRRWRSLFWQNRLAKSGRERRQRRQRRLLEKNSVEVDNASTFDLDSRTSSRAGSVLRGIEPYKDEVDMGSFFSKALSGVSSKRATEQQAKAGSKRPSSSYGIPHSSGTHTSNGHKRLKSTSHIDERGRVAKITKSTGHNQAHADLLKRSAFLAFSTDRSPPPKNTTTSSYFRLKAMGINRIESAVTPRGTKRRLSDASQAFSQTSPPALRSPGSSQDGSTTKALMPPPTSVPSRTSQSKDDDEALFARLRAARENLNQTTDYYKSEAIKDDKLRRSFNASQSSNEYESSSMMKARTDAKLRASLRGNDGAPGSTNDVPAYRLRESRFVPREHYGRAIERAKEIRESRSRETSRPESRNSHPQSNLGPAVPESCKATTSKDIDVLSHRPLEANGVTQSTTSAPSQSSQLLQMQPATFGGTFQSTFRPHVPISFTNHTTQLSNENPFLQDGTQNAFQISPPEVAPAKGSPLSNAKDQTIQPSQINQALAKSFGDSHGHGHNHMFSVSDTNPPATQQNSYLPTEPISLLSDDEDDAEDTPAIHFQPNGTHPAAEELRDETTEDDELYRDPSLRSGPYPAAMEGNPYRSFEHPNPYAALAHDGDTDDEHQDWDSQVDEEQRYDHESEDEPNGYQEYEHEYEAVDGDIDEDEDESQDMSSDREEDRYGDQDDDQSEGQYPEMNNTYTEMNNMWAHPEYGSPLRTAAKPSAFQAAGNNAEEAIELSD